METEKKNSVIETTESLCDCGFSVIPIKDVSGKQSWYARCLCYEGAGLLESMQNGSLFLTRSSPVEQIFNLISKC